jgi:pimeloyl-ACP methyl ester carboxylesterase
MNLLSVPYFVPFESGRIYVHSVTQPGNDHAVVILPGRSMSARNFWHFDPGTGVTHAEQLAAGGINVYMIDALGFGNSTGVPQTHYDRLYFAEQISTVLYHMPRYHKVSALGFCNTTMVPLVLLAQGWVDSAVVMSPTVFDRAWCADNASLVRLWQRTATESGFWSTSLEQLIEKQLNAISDTEIGEPQRVPTWHSEMRRLTQGYTSFNFDSWSAPRTWWLDRIYWPMSHDNPGFDTAQLNGKRMLFTRGEHDVEVPASWLHRAVDYFSNGDIETYTIPDVTHFALWEHGYQAAIDRVAEFLLT